VDDANELSMEDVLNAAYKGLLGREPDETGFGHYLIELQNGTPLSEVIRDLIRSSEFRARRQVVLRLQ
jgi:hypothetical protein